VRDDGRVVRRPGRYAAAAVGLALACSGCGAGSADSPPTGVDELTIPTPSPDPADFVHGVDNPWLALVPGRTWRYEVTGASEGILVVTVEDSTHDVAGVATTAVARTEPSGDQVVDYYAQDREGNVWWFGREGQWLAGQDGAGAGLAMPATPRLGDGWRAAYDAGVVDVRATVATTDQAVTTPAGRYDHLVALDVSDSLDQDSSRRVFYERGVGAVEEISTDGPIYLAELESDPR
jgi:hypothetical protein